MLKKKYECAKRWALGAMALVVMGNAIAAYTTNKFEPTQTVQGTKLQLNGAGIRFKALFKVYDVALYTTKQVNTAQELLSLAGPKKLSFVALRDISGTDLGVAFVRGMTTNTPTDLAHRQAISTNRLVEIFSGKHKLTEGDTFAIEYVPGRAGLRIREWVCSDCGAVHDRDTNAAKNILALGHRRLAGGILATTR